MEMRAIYEDILQQAIHSINGLQRRIGRVVWYRLVTFAMIAGATYLSITYAVWFSIVMFSCVVLFLFFVKQANELNEQKRQTEALAAACRRELKALQGELQAVVVNDIPAVHPYIHDLDVFGDQSLFSLINRSADEIGIPWLRDELLHLKASQKHANRRQAEVEILSEMHLVRLQIQAASAQLRISREELEDFTLWAEAEVHHPQWTWMVRLAPWYALPGFLLAVFGVLPSSLILAYFSVPLVVVGSQLKHTAKMAAALSGREKTMKHLAHLFRHAHGVDEKSGGKIQSARTLQDASEAFRNLARIASNTDQRSNIFAALLTNALFLAEIRNAHQANTWRQKHGHAVSGWFKALGELQGIASMGGFRANFRKQTCYPILTAQKEIQLAQAFHPLMLTGAAVANDISLNADQRVLLLTGANMAGKSTYLRVAGLHLVLASIGSCIPASSGAIGALDLFTSMRTTDSVQA
ncbi:MAG: hypothetical protein RL226_420, partial [Bacteroidota bacterium]